MFSGPKDYLFTDEADNTDRIFVNNQDSSLDASSALSSYSEDGKVIADSAQFTHSELKGKIVSNNFEYGEYNLGSGKDTVDISKTLYREDGFQTFTVVNTSKGEDKVTVSSYKDEADGKLVINTDEGDDIIKADSNGVTKNGMIIFGGEGADKIDVSKGVIAFGDMGNIQYRNAEGNVVTNLGYEKKVDGAITSYETIHTKISKVGDNLEKQTDGIAREASSIKSVGFDVGARDEITAGGFHSVVIGGAANDDIHVTGGENVVLGDNGEVNYSTAETVDTDWRNNSELVTHLDQVQTIENGIGDVDTITITGSNNVAMGGAANDNITISKIGDSSDSGSNNVVLGDGGMYEEIKGV